MSSATNKSAGSIHDAAGSSRIQRRSILGSLIVLLAGCGVLCWISLEVWEQNRPVQASIRAMRSWEPSERADAIRELEITGHGESRITLPPLVAALADPSAQVRVAAAITLGPLGAAAVTDGTGPDQIRSVIAALITALDDADPSVRTEAATAIGYVAGAQGASASIDLKAVCATLKSRFASRDPDTRLAALRVMTVVGPAAEPEPPEALVAALGDESPPNRAAAAAALAGFPHGLDPLIPRFLHLIEHDEPIVRATCSRALERIQPPAITTAAVPALIAAIDRPDVQVRAVACSILTHLGAQARAAIPALIGIARKQAPDPPDAEPWPGSSDFHPWPGSSSDHAIVALGRIAPQTDLAGETVAALTEIARGGELAMQTTVVGALGEFGPAAAPAIPELIRMLRSVEPSGPDYVNASAATALGRIAPGTPSSTAAVTALTEALHAESTSIRLAAVYALAQFGANASIAIPQLRALAHDVDPMVRWAVDMTLSRLSRAAGTRG
jgi:HEAT repeat protein